VKSEIGAANIYLGDSSEILKQLNDEVVDLTVTSPPYDDLRIYDGYVFDFEKIANELFRITKNGGVVVWIVADATVNGSETGTSFEQALYFKKIGFNIHDTMIWNKGGFSAIGSLKVRYAPVFEYMFVFSKGTPKTFNPIKDKPNIHSGKTISGTKRQADGSFKPIVGSGIKKCSEFGQRYNVWEVPPQRQKGDNKHPAPFPESIASDHIISWSNENDVVLDPFLGSGTTGACAITLKRNFIGCEISPKYFEMAKQRIQKRIEDKK
jgi:DNA modification methylase